MGPFYSRFLWPKNWGCGATSFLSKIEWKGCLFKTLSAANSGLRYNLWGNPAFAGKVAPFFKRKGGPNKLVPLLFASERLCAPKKERGDIHRGKTRPLLTATKRGGSPKNGVSPHQIAFSNEQAPRGVSQTN